MPQRGLALYEIFRKNPMTQQYWLMKSEPDAYGIQDLRREGTTLWDGIRNYQARNFMRTMNVGDQAFFYHSNCKPPGIIGLMEVTETGLIDPTQFDPKSDHPDPKSDPENPRWLCVDVKFKSKFKSPLTLKELKLDPKFADMTVVQKGNRLSVMPIAKKHFDRVLKLAL